MAEAKPDRRIQRTRLLLRSAMVSLIRERGFEALTVQDIIDRADVGRSTFYTHFKSKEDLLTGSVEMMRSTLRQFQRRAIDRSAKPADRMFAFSRELFEHAGQHRDVFAAMVGKRSGTLFQQHLHRMLAELVREDVEARPSRKKRDPIQVEAVVEFVAGGLLGLMVTWLEEMTRLSATDLDALFRRMAIPAVEAVLD
jgi:AcrR family transcriptional regulator